MEKFKRVLHDCKLVDIPFIGPKFRWSRGRGHNMILERLDRGLGSEKWMELFPFACEKHLTSSTLDHAPLLFYINSQQMQGSCTKRRFRFETCV